MSDATTWITLSHGLSIVVALLVDLALLVIAFAVVYKRDATAAWLTAGAAVVFLLATIASPVASLGVSRAAGATEEMMRYQSVLSLAFTVVRTAGWALLLGGIVKLARAGRVS